MPNRTDQSAFIAEFQPIRTLRSGTLAERAFVVVLYAFLALLLSTIARSVF